MNPLRVESATYDYDPDGVHAVLALALAGGPEARLYTESKATLDEAGLVFLGAEWEGLVPPIEFRAPDGPPTTLRGFTADPTIRRLYRRFQDDLAADRFAPGPVEVPAAE